MKKLFVHQPLFRLLSPFFSGIIVYLLLLLLNNNIAQIQEDFFNEELYFCIGLCYLVQEFSRLLLLLFKRFLMKQLTLVNILLQVFISLTLSLILATVAINLYFEFILGFSVTLDEIYVFNSIFCAITFIYILLYVSHQYLYKINTEKLTQELLIKKNIEDEFKQFKKGINPNLLFESLEVLLQLIQKDKEKSDDFIDTLAAVYRYILSGKDKQLINFDEELKAVFDLIDLLNYSPNKKINVKNNCKSSFLVVPGTLLFLVEQIVRTSIISDEIPLDILIDETAEYSSLSYVKNDKLIHHFRSDNLKDFIKSYKIYSLKIVEVVEEENERIIKIPKLQIAE